MANHVSRFTFDASRFMLLSVTVLAFAMRVYRLDAQSLWYDEAVTAHVAAQGIAELTRWTADDIQPPLYYYLVAGWTRLAGTGEWSLRFVSAFFSTLTVPLLWALARRLFGAARRGEIAGLIAALLAALSPLYVYYAQEARMYAQLTFLAALAGYALLRAMTDGGRPMTADRRPPTASHRLLSFVFRRSSSRWWLAFVMASVAALYTHYFAAFLLLAYGACVVVGLGVGVLRSRTRVRAGARTLLASGGAALAIAVLYLPWLPAMLTRYRVDRSYWQGALKLGEALRHVAISFTAGAPETMLEPDAARLLPWFGLAVAAALVALVTADGPLTSSGRVMAADTGLEPVERPTVASDGPSTSSGTVVTSDRPSTDSRRGGAVRGRSSAAILSAVLLIPLILILFLASRTPKFNARYLMMVSPAYLLILAGGIGVVGGGQWAMDDGRETAFHVSRFTLHAARFLAAIGFLFLAATSFASLRNWFTDPAFTKAQWRELVAAVRANIAPDEAVVLVSGHAWPAWDYYAPDIPRIRLPDIDILDVNAVLGFDSGAVLGRDLAGKSGVWLVRWQDDAVDPVGFVPYFLDRAGRKVQAPGPFWHVGLDHWRLNPDATFPSAPQPAHHDAANFDHKLALLGWDDPVGGQITVYWRGINTMTSDYQVSLVLLDAGGREVARWDGRPAGYEYPTTRWQPGQALFGKYPVALPDGAAFGDYTVTLVVYDAADPSGLDIRDIADNPAGKRVRLGPMKLNAER